MIYLSKIYDHLKRGGKQFVSEVAKGLIKEIPKVLIQEGLRAIKY